MVRWFSSPSLHQCSVLRVFKTGQSYTERREVKLKTRTWCTRDQTRDLAHWRPRTSQLTIQSLLLEILVLTLERARYSVQPWCEQKKWCAHEKLRLFSMSIASKKHVFYSLGIYKIFDHYWIHRKRKESSWRSSRTLVQYSFWYNNEFAGTQQAS